MKQSFFFCVAQLPKWRHRLALRVALLAVVVVFSVFFFTPAASAAPRHSEEQVAASSCYYHMFAQTVASGFTLRLWVYTCTGGVHAELLAQSSGSFWVGLGGYAAGQCHPSIEQDYGYLTSGQALNTSTYYGTVTWCVVGGYTGQPV